MASGSDPRKGGAGKEERRRATGVRSFSLGEKVGRGRGHTVLLKSSRVTCLGLIPGHGLLCASLSGQLLGVLSVGSLPVSTSLRRNYCKRVWWWLASDLRSQYFYSFICCRERGQEDLGKETLSRQHTWQAALVMKESCWDCPWFIQT